MNHTEQLMDKIEARLARVDAAYAHTPPAAPERRALRRRQINLAHAWTDLALAKRKGGRP